MIHLMGINFELGDYVQIWLKNIDDTGWNIIHFKVNIKSLTERRREGRKSERIRRERKTSSNNTELFQNRIYSLWSHE